MEQTTPTRRRAAHLGPERRRPQVLDAALKQFLRHGYDGTSMQAVADEAGVTKPVVYACFASKDELFRALLRREEERILGEIQTAFAGVNTDDPETTLVEGYIGFLRAVGASPEVYSLVFFGEGGANAAVAKRVEAGRQTQVDGLARLARRWIDHGAPGAEDGELDPAARSELQGQVLAGIAESGARMLLQDPERWPPEKLGARLGRLASAALAAA
jgi:AcrR family transcriptional regulator